ncbi:MAG: hypothetical protein Q8P25_01270 [Candidatus Curtissbacteria bacterium]|nr:hypothetical protein [Candidatus Curtissbacteria bacterium]
MIRFLRKATAGLISLGLHFAALSIIFTVIKPIAEWYLTKNPIRGTDIHLSAFYVNYILKWEEFIRPMAWKYTWFGGYPAYLDYPSLYFLAMAPLVKFYGLFGAVMHFAMLGFIVFAFASYFLYFELSKSRTLALFLTVCSLLSINIYLSLVWAGGIPFWTTQAFLPLAAYLAVKFLNSQNPRWLYSAAFVTGIGILGHPQGFLIAIIPFVSLILLFYKVPRFSSGLKNLFIYFSLAFLVALPGIPWAIVSTMFSGFFSVFKIIAALLGIGQAAGGIETGVSRAPGSVDPTKSISFVFSGNQQYVWFALIFLFVIWFLFFILGKRKNQSLSNVSPFVFFLAYYLILLFLFSRRIDFFFGAWYKALWATPVILGSAVAIFAGEIQSFLKNWLVKIPQLATLGVIVDVVLLSIIYFSIPPVLVKNAIDTIDLASIQSSTHPNFLSREITDRERVDLAKKLVPGNIDIWNDKNKRLYAIDATFNMWWNSLFDMPLARGYIDPPITNTERWGLFWLDSALGPSSKDQSSSLSVDWNLPKDLLFENYKFLLDWNAVYYLGGNWNMVVSNNLAQEAISKELVEKNEKVLLPRPEWNPVTDGYSELAQYQVMNFYKVRDELVSPILAPANASAILLIGDSSAYDTIYRFLGMKNLNSQKVIVATKSKYIDDHNLNELKKFNALILYRYDYKKNSKAWGLIRKYLQDGGNVYIETGTEVKESEGGNLPDFFPFVRTERRDIGKDWLTSDADEKVSKDVNFSNFSPLVYNDAPWMVSYPTEVKSPANIILKNNGKVVSAQTQVGKGNLIWTGFNLPYHSIFTYNNEEATFLTNILSQIVDLSQKDTPDFNLNWISPEKREITFSGAKAVLFKEENFPGWQAKMDGKGVSIYKVGPTSPGYIYIPFDSKINEGKVILSYRGQIIWRIWWGISALSILILLEMIITGRMFTLWPIKRIYRKIIRLSYEWWDKEV